MDASLIDLGAHLRSTGQPSFASFRPGIPCTVSRISLELFLNLFVATGFAQGARYGSEKNRSIGISNFRHGADVSRDPAPVAAKG